MIVQRDTTGVTVRTHTEAPFAVRLGPTRITFEIPGPFRFRDLRKPHDEFTLNELRDLLDEATIFFSNSCGPMAPFRT